MLLTTYCSLHIALQGSTTVGEHTLLGTDLLVSLEYVGDKSTFDADACEGGLIALNIKPYASGPRTRFRAPPEQGSGATRTLRVHIPSSRVYLGLITR